MDEDSTVVGYIQQLRAPSPLAMPPPTLRDQNLDAFEETAGGATCVRFSPSGGLLSAGSGDGSLQSWGTSERNWVKTGSAQNLVSHFAHFPTAAGIALVSNIVLSVSQYLPATSKLRDVCYCSSRYEATRTLISSRIMKLLPNNIP